MNGVLSLTIIAHNIIVLDNAEASHQKNMPLKNCCHYAATDLQNSFLQINPLFIRIQRLLVMCISILYVLSVGKVHLLPSV